MRTGFIFSVIETNPEIKRETSQQVSYAFCALFGLRITLLLKVGGTVPGLELTRPRARDLSVSLPSEGALDFLPSDFIEENVSLFRKRQL